MDGNTNMLVFGRRETRLTPVEQKVCVQWLSGRKTATKVRWCLVFVKMGDSSSQITNIKIHLISTVLSEITDFYCQLL